jgi:hypothetical protein
MLKHVIETNTCLWGGIFNFIIPLFSRAPTRYRDLPFPGPTARQLRDGLIEAFEPDFLVETQPGLASQVSFPPERIIGMDSIFQRDEHGRGGYGITILDVCGALYQDTFRFVQRHPQRAIVPQPSERRYELLTSATFGAFPQTGPLSQFRQHFEGALDAKEEKITCKSLFGAFRKDMLFPLRVGAHGLTVDTRRWAPDPMLFYMDESSTIDIIEFWNFRALGWRVKPLPRSCARELKDECEAFLRQSYQPYPPPSNAFRRGTFLCSKSCSFEDLKEFVGTLKRETPDTAISIDPRFPRLWEEWGRNADHAMRQEVTYSTEEVTASELHEHVTVQTVLPDFVEQSRPSADYACANVMESLPGAAAVMPLRIRDFQKILREYDPRNVWPSREGIIAVCGSYDRVRIWKKPSPLAIFSAWLEAYGLKAELSSSGRITNQIIQTMGGLRSVPLIANEEVLRLLHKMAHGDVEIEIEPDDPKRKRSVRAYAIPRQQILALLSRACGSSNIGNNLLASLLSLKILVVGLRLQCPECKQNTWYRLADIDPSLRCERCLQIFDFPAADPPRDVWAYRVNGPFAIENYAQGAYCVAFALHFIDEQLADGTSWVPSVSLTGNGASDLEADFVVFLRPRIFSQIAEPFVIFGECKSFNCFEPKDVRRMEAIASRFPGAVLCFATLNQQLTSAEKKAISRLARKGRRHLRTGQQINPVLILTKAELLGRGGLDGIAENWPLRFKANARNIFFRGDIQEICDVTQQVHLGIESFHDWLESKAQKRRLRKGKAKKQ